MSLHELARHTAICGYLFGVGSMGYLAASYSVTATFGSIALIAASLFVIYS